MSKSLSKLALYQYFKESIGDNGSVEPISSIPYRVRLESVNIDFDVYMWNIIFTCETSNKRPKNEYRMNFNIHDKRVNWAPNILPIYCGYCADFDVFVLWDCRRHRPDISIGNLQVKSEALIDGMSFGYVYFDRFVNRGIETIIVCKPQNLAKAFEDRYRLFLEDLCSNRPEVVLNNHSNHNSYGIVYRYYVNHPEATFFEMSHDLKISPVELKKILFALYSTADYPRNPFTDDEDNFIKLKIISIHKVSPNRPIQSILASLYITQAYADEHELYSFGMKKSTLDDYLRD